MTKGPVLTTDAIIFGINTMIENGLPGITYKLVGHKQLELINDGTEIGICMRNYYGDYAYAKIINKSCLLDEIGLRSEIEKVTMFGNMTLREEEVA